MEAVGERDKLSAPTVSEQAGDAAQAPLLAPLLARGIVFAAYVAFCVIAFVYVVYAGTPFWESVQAAGYLTVVLGLQVYFSRPDTSANMPVTYAVLVTQAFLVLVPLTQFGQSWIIMPTLLAANAPLVLRARWGWVVFGLVVLLAPVLELVWTGDPVLAARALFGATVAALEIYGLTRLARLITEVHDARAELGNAAVARERMRFSQDLHDLLGLSLSTVGPKAVAARDAMATDPERARAELAEILTVSRHALADVRLVASGYRDTSLDEESRTVESLLADSDIDVRIEVSHGELPVEVRTVVVAVLRAGSASVLNKPGVNTCSITMRRVGDAVQLDIVDDGEPDDDGAPLGDTPADTAEMLMARVVALGGTLTRGPRAGGGSRLRLRVPLGEDRADERIDREEPADQVPRKAASLASWLMRAVFIGLVVNLALKLLLRDLDTITVVTSIAYGVGLLAVQLGYVSSTDRVFRPPMTYIVLAVQALLVFLPLWQFGAAWVSIPGLLAGSALLLLRPLSGWLVFTGVVAATVLALATFVGDAIVIADTIASTVSIGLVTYGLTWMARAMHQLRSVRRELARVAVADERMRFARDLHDLLGLSLSAITLKTELAQRLMTADQDRTRRELMEIVDISRLALADVRLVASGYRELSLNEESRSAESVLVAADVDVRLEMHYGELSPEVRTVLATVLREGVANVLRHSVKGARCEITVRQVDRMVMLEIVNNGVAGEPTLSPGGSGLRNLSARVERLGGELTAGLSADGTFRLSARVPA
ncbi:sensor histidine kinase [Actinokineospora sp. UTMC 2448]|uniref:sensor histidine kinase n=1 Tax=Actinokineospora sp. UTMC 2448 TaxID=2268449 RepID=UPI0021646123|nr:histidine kinase [Actinokineospora sp. UTMC 2448]UVS79990.1 Sensor histidine kinase DesK [Actinokineospora sp. UTMC 2448]